MTSHVLTQLGQVLLQSLWQGAILGVVLMVLLAFIRQSSVRYVLACLTLFTLLGWVVVSLVQASSLSLTRVHSSPVASESVQPSVASSAQAADGSVVERRNQSLLEPSQPVTKENREPDLMVAQPQTRVASFNFDLQKILPYISLVWMIGVAALSLRLLASFYLLRKYRKGSFELMEPWIIERVQRLANRLKLRQHITLLQTNTLAVPAVMGVLKPLVLLPSSLVSGLSVGQLELLLAHELAHIKRRDYLVNILQTLAETLLFYHPVVWWVSRVIRQEREHCCDDLALRLTGQSAVEYADVLLRLEKSRQTLALAASSGSLLRRVERLLSPPKAGVSGGSSLATLAFVVCLSVMLAVNAAIAQPIQVSKAPYVFNAGIAVDPTNSERIAVAVNQVSNYDCKVILCKTTTLLYTSKDAGVNWQEQSPYGVRDDTNTVQVMFDSQGKLYATTDILTFTLDRVSTYVTQADADMQVKKDDATRLRGDKYGSRLTVDPNSGKLYLSYLAVSEVEPNFWVGVPELRTSENSGTTWSDPVSILEKSVWETNGGYLIDVQILLGEDNNLAVVWTQIDDMLFKKSDTMSLAVSANALPYSVWIVSSEDTGKTFSKPRKIDYGTGGVSWGGVSTAFVNGVYYVLTKQVSMPEGRMGLVLVSSFDNGKSWVFSRVNGDIELYTSFPIEITPGMSVASDGTIDIVFYEQTNAPDCISVPAPYVMFQSIQWTDKCNYNVYYTFSKDGGKTFSTPQKLNDDPTVGSRFVRLYGTTTPGQSIGIASTIEAAYPVWIGNREGVEGTQAYMMKIER